MKSETTLKPSFGARIVSLFGWLAVCYMAASTGAFVSTGDWYASLTKPSWNPPAWIFGPVWSFLYTVMAVAAWLVWCIGGWKQQRAPLGLFVVQLMLNAIWTPLFFGLHLPSLAFGEIILLWFALAATLYLFWTRRRLAGVLLIPYLIWISFAAYLNFTIWQLNS